MKDVIGYEGFYQVNEIGQVKSLSRKGRRADRILKPGLNGCGYLTVILYRDSVRTGHLVHRLIAEVYLPNPDSLSQVNHINGIKTDNRVENLEWCTQAQNIKHSQATGLVNPRLMPRQVLCHQTGVIYESQCAAARELGLHQGHISGVILGKCRHKGYTFERVK